MHDPAPRSGPTTSHDHVQLLRLTRGYREDDDVSAVGSYQTAGGLKIKAGADLGILVGAVVARLDGRDPLP